MKSECNDNVQSDNSEKTVRLIVKFAVVVRVRAVLTVIVRKREE